MRKKLNERALFNFVDTLDGEALRAFDEEVMNKLATFVERFGSEHQAVVSSAIALTQKEKRRITTLFTHLSGHKITIDFEVDRNLLGGLRITIGDLKLDGTLRGQLNKITTQLVS